MGLPLILVNAPARLCLRLSARAAAGAAALPKYPIDTAHAAERMYAEHCLPTIRVVYSAARVPTNHSTTAFA